MPRGSSVRMLLALPPAWRGRHRRDSRAGVPTDPVRHPGRRLAALRRRHDRVQGRRPPAPRGRRRPVHAPVGPRREGAAGGCARPRERRVRLGNGGSDPARASRRRHRRGRESPRRAGLGERRRTFNWAPSNERDLPTSPTRPRSVIRGSASGRSGTSRTRRAGSGRRRRRSTSAPAQPRLRRHPLGDSRRRRCRWCDRARAGAGGGQSPVAWIRGMGAAPCPSRRLRAPPVPGPAEHRDAVDGRRAHCSTITMADLERLRREVRRAFGAKRIWLTEYGYQSNPPDRTLGDYRW